MKILEIDLPDYSVDSEPDHQAIGKPVDDLLKAHFMAQTILLRGLGSMEHPDKSIDDLIQLIKTSGTDRYDPNRAGDRYANTEDKRIDLYALQRTISPRSKIFWQLSWSFYQSPLKTRGYPVRVDILVIYDPKQLRAVVHQPVGNSALKRDGFVFKNPDSIAAAILAIIKIN